MSWTDSLRQKLTAYANEEINYKETKDINEAAQLGFGATGLYMEASIIYFEIKNVPYILKEHGRRKMVQCYTMVSEILHALTEQSEAFVNSLSPSAFLVVFPGKEKTFDESVKYALKVSQAITKDFKSQFESFPGFEFAMGIDHGHIMGTKTLSDNGTSHVVWYGLCVYKAQRICKECARPFYIGISGCIYHGINESLKSATRRILGVKKSVDIWTKISYRYENVKKHLYQTNHKISLDET